MSNDRRTDDRTERRSTSATARSPAEALEPTRGPSRPSGPRRSPRRRKLSPALRFLNTLLTLTAFSLTICGAGAYWVSTELTREGPLKEARNFIVPRGEGAHDIAKRLEADGIITSQQMFVGNYIARYMASWFGTVPLQLKAGEYEIPAGASLRLVSEVLGEGRSTLQRVTVPEGLTSAQIVARLRSDPNLAGDITDIPPEGTLLPDTYKFSRGMTRQQILELMQAEQRKLVERLWAARQADLPLKTPEEAVILASIVEKETGRNDERDKVSAVFVNRMRQNIRLQSDPTILYGLFLGEVAWGRPIYKSEIQQKTAHNTYQIDGLPPTPICNPGKSALEATLNPAKTGDLYFVANGQGGHVFTTNLKDHNTAVATWRKTEQDIRSRQASAGASAAKPATKSAPVPVTLQTAPPVDSTQQPAPEGPTSPQTPAIKESVPPQSSATASADASVPLPVRKPKRP